jgi:hypothetical protein
MSYIEDVLDIVARRNAGEPEFLQAVREVLESLELVVERNREIPGRAHSGTHRRTRTPDYLSVFPGRMTTDRCR